MKIIPSFDPSATTSGEMSIGAVDEGSSILLYNLSIVNILLNFNDGNSSILHAGEANYWILNGSTTTISWSQYSMLNTPNPAISQVTGIVYAADEPVTGTYPMSFVNQVNIGGAVSVSGAESVTNTGNPPATNILNVRPSDALLSTWTADNSGNLKVLGDNAGVLTSLLQLIAGASPKVLLAAAGILTEIAGALQVDQAATINGLLTAAANLAVTGTLTTSGAATINGLLTAAASLAVTGTVNAGGSITTNGNLSAATIIVSSGGITLQNNQVLQWDNFSGTPKNILYLNTTNDVNIAAADTNNVYFRDNAGNIHTQLTNSAISGQIACTNYALLNAGAGSYHMHVNGLSAIDSGNFNSSVTAATHTHNLGSVPQGVMVCGANSGGTAAFSSVDTFTSTTFTSKENTAGTQMRYLAWRY